MSLYTPVVQTRYLPQGLFEEPKFAALMSSGALDVATIEEVFAGKRAGDFVNIPRIVQAADFSRVAIGSTSSLSFTAVSTNDGKVPVLRDVSPNKWFMHQLAQTGEDLGMQVGKTIGNKLAKRYLNQIDRSLQGVINVSGVHLNDITASSPVTLHALAVIDARAKLGDQADSCKTMMLHSKAWKSLLKDIISTYKYAGVWSGAIFSSGELEGILGIRNFIVTDAIASEAAQTSTTTQSHYYSWIFGEGALYFAYQQTPYIENWRDVTNIDTIHYERVDLDYVAAPRGFTMATANPTDANLSTPGTWTAAYEDHRNFRVVAVKSTES